MPEAGLLSCFHSLSSPLVNSLAKCVTHLIQAFEVAYGVECIAGVDTLFGIAVAAS